MIIMVKENIARGDNADTSSVAKTLDDCLLYQSALTLRGDPPSVLQ